MATELERRQLAILKSRANRTIELFRDTLEFELSHSEDGKIEKNNILEIINRLTQEDEIHIQELMKDKRECVLERSLFPKPDEILGETDRVKLIAFSGAYKDRYLYVTEQGKKSKNNRNPKEEDALFKSCMSPVSLYYAVCDRSTDEYMGYIAIKDITRQVWEFSIELLEMYRYQGIGKESLSLMLDKMNKISGETTYRCRIFPDNYASQTMVKKLGAKPNGITECILYGSDIEEFEENNLELIDENLKIVADEFQVEPRKLLSHILEYIIEWR